MSVRKRLEDGTVDEWVKLAREGTIMDRLILLEQHFDDVCDVLVYDLNIDVVCKVILLGKLEQWDVIVGRRLTSTSNCIQQTLVDTGDRSIMKKLIPMHSYEIQRSIYSMLFGTEYVTNFILDFINYGSDKFILDIVERGSDDEHKLIAYNTDSPDILAKLIEQASLPTLRYILTKPICFNLLSSILKKLNYHDTCNVLLNIVISYTDWCRLYDIAVNTHHTLDVADLRFALCEKKWGYMFSSMDYTRQLNFMKEKIYSDNELDWYMRYGSEQTREHVSKMRSQLRFIDKFRLRLRDGGDLKLFKSS